LYESAIASRFVFSRKFVALQLSTFATQSGDKRTSLGHRECVAIDPQRRFATANYRIAKGSLTLDWASNASFVRWWGRSTAGPFHQQKSVK
jgi:hypothetical protein